MPSDKVYKVSMLLPGMKSNYQNFRTRFLSADLENSPDVSEQAISMTVQAVHNARNCSGIAHAAVKSYIDRAYGGDDENTWDRLVLARLELYFYVNCDAAERINNADDPRVIQDGSIKDIWEALPTKRKKDAQLVWHLKEVAERLLAFRRALTNTLSLLFYGRGFTPTVDPTLPYVVLGYVAFRRGIPGQVHFDFRVITKWIIDSSSKHSSDPRAELLRLFLHELSHSLMKTKDYFYLGGNGEGIDAELSNIRNPRKPEYAISNADSYAYFIAASNAAESNGAAPDRDGRINNWGEGLPVGDARQILKAASVLGKRLEARSSEYVPSQIDDHLESQYALIKSRYSIEVLDAKGHYQILNRVATIKNAISQAALTTAALGTPPFI